jgi:nitroreductase
LIEEGKMDIIDAVRSRRSIRRFKTEPVSKEVLEKLLEVSRWSPSGSNTQPWEVSILGGKILEEVKVRLAACMPSVESHPDIPYPPMPEPFRSRQKELMQLMDAYLFPPGTEELKEKRAANRFSSGRFFEAPNAIIVSVEREISPRAFLGLGMFAQTVSLGALDFGLGTCIMSMAVYWPEIYRELLGIPDSRLIAFAIAIGYPDMEARINNFERTRVPLATNVRWHGL